LSKADTREWYLSCFVCLARLKGWYGGKEIVSDDTMHEISHVSFSSLRRRGVIVAWFWINHTLHTHGQLYGYLWCVVTVSHTVGKFRFDDDVSDVSLFFTYTWLAKSVYIFWVYSIDILSSTLLKHCCFSRLALPLWLWWCVSILPSTLYHIDPMAGMYMTYSFVSSFAVPTCMSFFHFIFG